MVDKSIKSINSAARFPPHSSFHRFVYTRNSFAVMVLCVHFREKTYILIIKPTSQHGWGWDGKWMSMKVGKHKMMWSKQKVRVISGWSKLSFLSYSAAARLVWRHFSVALRLWDFWKIAGSVNEVCRRRFFFSANQVRFRVTQLNQQVPQAEAIAQLNFPWDIEITRLKLEVSIKTSKAKLKQFICSALLIKRCFHSNYSRRHEAIGFGCRRDH